MKATEIANHVIDPSLVEAVADQFRRISWRARANSHEDWNSLRLTRAQLRILAKLQQEGPATVGQLAGHLGLSLPSITATVDRLARAGLVVRQDDATDRRRVINVLTSQGSTMIDRLFEGKKVQLIAVL